MINQSLKQLQQALAAKTLSSVELTQYFLNRIKQYDQHLNSFITVCEQSALEKAKVCDEQLAKGEHAPLTGLPIAHKDVFCTQGIKTTCASKMLANFTAPYDATIVKQLDAAGCITIGKTNMDEFAMGSSNETSYFGGVNNPWCDNCTPGGSSGGSAAAVAAYLVPATTGTDTGGSIRQPASYTGICGLKPTYGRVSRWGMIAFASSLDTAGPMARSAEDLALLFNAMAGFDEKDSTSIDHPVPDYTATLNHDIKGKRLGLPKQFFEQNLDRDVSQLIEQALKEFEKLGATLVDIELPNNELSIPAYYIIAPAEASSNLSRFDGVRYGHRCDDPQDLMDLYCRSRGEGFGEEVKRRIMLGTYALSTGYYNAYYVKAQKVRQIISDDFQKAFNQVDAIIGPTTPSPAFTLGSMQDNPLSMYLTDIYTIGVNLAGLPGLSIPIGLSAQKPVGMQIIGNHFAEDVILNIGHQFQQVTDWHLQTPQTFFDSEK